MLSGTSPDTSRIYSAVYLRKYKLEKIPFNNRYIQLGNDFYASAQPSPAENPELIAFNEELAADLGLSAANLNSIEGTAIF